MSGSYRIIIRNTDNGMCIEQVGSHIQKGMQNFPFRVGSRVLYLGASTGTTVSHISDIVGNEGIIFAVEPAVRVAREPFRKRGNAKI